MNKQRRKELLSIRGDMSSMMMVLKLGQDKDILSM